MIIYETETRLTQSVRLDYEYNLHIKEITHNRDKYIICIKCIK